MFNSIELNTLVCTKVLQYLHTAECSTADGYRRAAQIFCRAPLISSNPVNMERCHERSILSKCDDDSTESSVCATGDEVVSSTEVEGTAPPPTDQDSAVEDTVWVSEAQPPHVTLPESASKEDPWKQLPPSCGRGEVEVLAKLAPTPDMTPCPTAPISSPLPHA